MIAAKNRARAPDLILLSNPDKEAEHETQIHMKKGAFIDAYAEDPRNRNPEFARVRASQKEYLYGKYLVNQSVLEQLGRVYTLEIYSEIMLAASMIANRNQEKSLDFVVTDIPPSKEAETLARERNVEIRKKLANLGVFGREEALRQIIEDEERFRDKIYSASVLCLGQLRMVLPGIAIIAYTDAPESICQRCLDGGGVDYVIPRKRYGLSDVVEKMKGAIESGK